MYIKQVIIRGFKTYKEQTSLDEDFSPGTNVVVGFNGAGKSNFFQAILFVLSDQYASLRAETRKALLHEGAGQAVLTAYVEVILDNSDKRIPIDGDQVAIRRLIGVKKDDWLLDGRHSTKAEIFGLLESAGFAKSSPYYIVQQGKVGELTLMSDAQRLGLLRDISGAGVYDDRRAESMKIMADTATRRSRTQGLMEEVQTKLKSLEDEQRELRECENLEGRKRTLEYILADREWRAAQDRIEELTSRKSEASARLGELQGQMGAIRKQAADVDINLEQQEDEKRRTAQRLAGLEAERDKRFEALAAARNEAEGESRRQRESEDRQASRLGEVQRARGEVEAAERELASARPGAEKAEARVRELEQRCQAAIAQREQLLAKQSRKDTFKSVEERNKALDAEIQRGTGRLAEAQIKMKACEERLARAEEKKTVAAQEAVAKRAELAAVEKQMSDVGGEMRQLGEQLDKCSEQTRLLHQQRSSLVREVEQRRQEAANFQGRLEATMPRAYRQATTAVMRWTEERGYQERIKGMLLSHIEVPATFRAAVESFAGMALFNILAVDDEVAAEAVKFVRTKRLGAVVVTPLSQLELRSYDYPRMEGVKPLVDIVKCPEWAKAAVQQVFGRGVVCRSMELCEQVARSHGVDAITLDGDRVSRRGVVSGGYQDPQRFVRLPLAENLRAAKRKALEVEARLPQLEAQLSEASERLDSLHAERRQRQERRDGVRASMQKLTENVQSLEAASSKYARDISELQEWKHRMTVLIGECEASMKAKKGERASKTLRGLSEEEEARLKSLSDDLQAGTNDLEAAKAERSKLQAALGELEAKLEGCLRKRLHALELEVAAGSQEDALERADEAAQACARLEREHREASDGAVAAAAEARAFAEACEALRRRREELSAQEQQLQDEATQVSLRLDRLETEATAQAQKKAEVDGRLGSLAVPAADLEQARQLPKPELVRELAEVGRQMQGFQNVNRKAVEQYENFAEQLRDLERRLVEIDAGEESIKQALEQIDEQKESAILQTLRRVNEHFKDVFAEMVPGGAGKLLVIRDSAADESQDQQVATGRGLSGVRIEVSFTGQAQSFLAMNQLSGGQKTVVALSLIFAIQRLEPAPFYLLDEVDAALDASYRSALANLVGRTASGGSQVILTTFRPEALDKADRCYRVYQQNRASRIDAVTPDQARQVLVEQDRLAQAAAAAGAIEGPR
mmetsp:Transcript_47196/g.137270  ORF Transcript_47196/g.137270 Transcript_47196/m.137270 type:complete len:1208 (-) Transcript_47196:81-3704(-)